MQLYTSWVKRIEKPNRAQPIHIVAEMLLYGYAVYIFFFKCKGQLKSCVLLKCNMSFRECTLLISVFKKWQHKKKNYIGIYDLPSTGTVMMTLSNIQYLKHKYTIESMKK